MNPIRMRNAKGSTSKFHGIHQDSFMYRERYGKIIVVG